MKSATKIEVGRESIDSTAFTPVPHSPLFLFSNTPLKPLGVGGEQSPVDGVKWWEKALKSSEKQHSVSCLVLYVSLFFT